MFNYKWKLRQEKLTYNRKKMRQIVPYWKMIMKYQFGHTRGGKKQGINIHINKFCAVYNVIILYFENFISILLLQTTSQSSG